MTEIWKPISETTKDYEVSNFGRIMNMKTGKLIVPRPIKTGYLRVHLPVIGGRKDFYIHRLVAEAFCEHREGCNVVNHIDNNKQNNHADNIEWVTPFENVHHGMRQKRYRLNAVRVIGTKDGNSVEYISTRQAEVATGCDHSSIIRCCKGKLKTTNGYLWKYAEVV